MEQSILKTVKKMLGLAEDYTAFDLDVMVHINSAFSILASAGATPPGGWGITSDEETWDDFLIDPNQTSMAKSYIFIIVKQLFDPSGLSFVNEGQTRIANEILWRLNSLELVFNPAAYDYIMDPENAVVWILEDDQAPFPPEAKEGDLAYNPSTGNIWRFRR